MNINEYLHEFGYVVIPNILSPDEVTKAKDMFYVWYSNLENIQTLHKKINPHGIFKYHQAGHQEHAWYIRTRDNVQKPFKQFYNTDDLIVSFDGSCYLSDTFNKSKDNCWIHTDQAPCLTGFQCLQGFVSLTNNINSTLVVYEGSHKLHQQYFEERNIRHKVNWNKIDPDYLATISDKKRVLQVPAGSLVLWDSRTFHQNQYGSPHCEERIVQYVCYLPKAHPKNTKAMQSKRRKYFEEKRTTSHWPCPIRVNSLQPQTYGNNDLLVNYESLLSPHLDPYIDEIYSLI